MCVWLCEKWYKFVFVSYAKQKCIHHCRHLRFLASIESLSPWCGRLCYFFFVGLLFLIVDQIMFESNLVRLHLHHFYVFPAPFKGNARKPRNRRWKKRKEITAHMKEWATASEKKASNPFKIRFIFIVRDLQIVTDRLRQILLCSIKSTTPSCVWVGPVVRIPYHTHTFHKWHGMINDNMGSGQIERHECHRKWFHLIVPICVSSSLRCSFHFRSCLMCAHELRVSQFTANERYHFVFLAPNHSFAHCHFSVFLSFSFVRLCLPLMWRNSERTPVLAKNVKTKSSVHAFWTVTTASVLIRHFHHGKLNEWFVTAYKTKSQIRNKVLRTASVNSDATKLVANRKLNSMWPKNNKPLSGRPKNPRQNLQHLFHSLHFNSACGCATMIVCLCANRFLSLSLLSYFIQVSIKGIQCIQVGKIRW